MNHIDQDTLLKLTMGLLEPVTDQQVMEHIMQCPECMQSYITAKSQADMLGSYQPEFEVPKFPLPSAKIRRFTPLLKIAAILTIGFLTGFVFSEMTSTEPVLVVQQTLVSKPEVRTAGYTHCHQVDTRVNTY